MPPAGKDEALAIGYLFVLKQLLEHLRYRTDGAMRAAKLIAGFQAEVAVRAEAGHVDARMLALVGGALHQSKIPASLELAAASAKHALDQDERGPLPPDVGVALAACSKPATGIPSCSSGP